LYEQSLNLDGSRANTLACLYVCKMKEDGGGQDLLNKSLLREGFIDALSLELKERGARALDVFQALPSWLKYLINPSYQGSVEGYGN
jgi:hypothetical protein